MNIRSLLLTTSLMFTVLGLAQAELVAPMLLQPDNEVNLPFKKSAKFTWEKVTGAKKYRLIFSNDESFSNYDANKFKCLDKKTCFVYTVTSPPYNMAASHTMMKTNGDYFWQVQAVNIKEVSEIATVTTEGGEVRSFSIEGLYTKIANNGSNLSDDAKLGTSANDWACTKDNKTGLIWEIKTKDGGLRDMSNAYTWYNPDKSTNGGFEGYFNDGYFKNYYPICKGSYCDTFSYVQAVNTQGLCGEKNWRMPTIDELTGIFVASPYKIYFPNTSKNPGFFWSSTPNSTKSGSAYGFNFNNGASDSGYKFGSVNVRLVR